MFTSDGENVSVISGLYVGERKAARRRLFEDAVLLDVFESERTVEGYAVQSE